MNHSRVLRGKKIIELLKQEFGMKDLAFEEFAQINHINMETCVAETQIGRPTIAAYLVQKGYIKTVSEGFKVYLSDQSPAY